MKLIYLWINNYKTLQKQGIFLNSHYKVSENPKIGFQVQLCKSKSMDIYRPIEKITSIIGKNGSGKSSLLEVLITLLTSNGGADAFLIVEIDGKLFTIGEAQKVTFQNEVVSPFPPDKQIPASLIYYSPIYSPHNLDIRSQSKNKILADVSNNNCYAGSLSSNQRRDIEQQFRFLQDHAQFSEKALGFKKFFLADVKPFNLFIFRKNFFMILETIRSNSSSNESKEALKLITNIKVFPSSFRNDLEDYCFSGPEISEKAKYGIDKELQRLTHWMQNRYLNERRWVGNLKQYFILQVLEKEISPSKNILFKAQSLRMMFEVIFDIDHRKHSSLRDRHSERFYEKIGRAEEDGRALSRFFEGLDVGNTFPLYFDTGMSKKVIELVNEIHSSRYSSYDIDIRWNGMSSGQIAKLNLFSRLYKGLLNHRKKVDIIVILDEADIYLHPEWQRSFLHELRAFFHEVAKDKKIELVLTSHSPLMISDIEKENVFIIDREDDESHSKITSPEIETFASNLHSMYQKSFLLQSTIGKLAYEFVEKFEEEVRQNENPSLEVVGQWFAKLEKVSEPVIRHGLENLIRSHAQKALMVQYYQAEIQRLMGEKTP